MPRPKGKQTKTKQKKKAGKRPPGPSRRKQLSAATIGKSVGGFFGPTAAQIGSAAGSLFSKLTGFGDYKVSSNTLTTNIDSLPTFRNSSKGTRIMHREYLFDLVTSPVAGTFQVQQLALQPGLITTFPWLSPIGEQYEEYELMGVVFEFKSNSYDALASTNTASGTVIMTTNYNVLSPPFTTKLQMEQYQYTCSAKPSVSLLHPVECARGVTPVTTLFTRAGPVTTGDLRLYDWGNFNVATVGMQGTSVNVGEIWVTYDIMFHKPKLTAASDLADHYTMVPAHTTAGGPNYFGSAAFPPVLSSSSDMGTRLFTGVTGLDTIIWPPGYSGNVLVTILYSLTSTAVASLATPYGIVTSTGVSQLPLFSNGRASNEGPGPLVYNGNGGCTFVLMLNILNGGSVRFIGGTNNGALTTADLFIVAMPISLTN